MTPRLHFHFLSLFPEAIEVWLTTSILGRAHDKGLFAFTTYQLREYSTDKHRTVDDMAYGGGGGMVLKIEPLVRALEDIRARHPNTEMAVLHFSPAGRRLSQGLLDELTPATGATTRHLVLVCGHYEGIDQRFVDHYVDLEVSLGDFVLTGGELPAVALADALIRQERGALGYEDASHVESFRIPHPDTGKPGLLEFPHYTRPAEFRGLKVPDVLLSGNHEAVERWRHEEALRRTRQHRPDLL